MFLAFLGPPIRPPTHLFADNYMTKKIIHFMSKQFGLDNILNTKYLNKMHQFFAKDFIYRALIKDYPAMPWI